MIIFLCIIMFSWVMCGCGGGFYAQVFDSISEMQESIFVGQSQGIKASLVVGYREKEYIKDGRSGETIPFAVLTFEGEEKGEIVANEFVFVSGENSYAGALQKNPYTGAYQADMGEVCLCETMVASATIGDKTIDIALLPLFDDIGCMGEDALKIVLDKFGDEIKKECYKGGEFYGEIYVKLFGTLSRGAKDKCWGITILKEDGRRLNFVVSEDTGEVLAR